jgi:hypothetical protein
MTSVQRRYAQRDNRLETVTLTGYIQNNGDVTGGTEQPAFAEINLTKAQNFYIDTRNLVLRTEFGAQYLLRIYMTSTKPPLYYQNFEWTIFIELPATSLKWIAIQVYRTKEEAEDLIGSNFLFELSNESPDGINIYPGRSAITMQVMNNQYLLKSASPNLFYG